MKTLSIILAMNYKDGDKTIQTAQLIRDGKAIGTKDFINGQCISTVVIDSLSLEHKCYFDDEARDVCRLNPPSLKFNQPEDRGAKLETYMAVHYPNVI